MSTTVIQGNYQQDRKPVKDCPQLPGTILRIFIPAGAVINLLNLIELTSPSGICLIIRIPILGNNLDGVLEAIRDAGGTVEVVKPK